MSLIDSTRRQWAPILTIVATICAFYVRVRPYWSRVLKPEHVDFQGNDPWYHMRLVDHLVENFPLRIAFDPYRAFPDGQVVDVAPLLDWVIAGTSLVLGRGNPSNWLVERVGAFTPPVLGALVCIPVYLLAKRLFGKLTAVLSAGIVGVIPGQFFLRSALGFTDHHVLEVLLAMSCLACLVSSVTLDEDYPSKRRRLLGSLGGMFLGLYLLSWVAGSLFVGVLTVSWGISIMVGFRQQPAPARLLESVVPCYLAALIVYLPFSGGLSLVMHTLAALVLGLLAVLVLALLSIELDRRRTSRAAFVLLVLLLGGASILVLRLALPEQFSEIAKTAELMNPDSTGLTVGELRPLLASGGQISLAPAWYLFASGLMWAPIGFAMAAARLFRRYQPQGILIATTGAIFLALTLLQNRHAYYLEPFIAIYSGYFMAWLVRLLTGSSAVSTDRSGGIRLVDWMYRGLAVAGLYFLVLQPSLRMIEMRSDRAEYLEAAWREALSWLQENSPEPFGSADFYSEVYATDEDFQFPESAYGVLATWDYGYHICRIGHRVPVANPTQRGARETAQFFLADDEMEAAEVAQRVGARYVITSKVLPLQLVEGDVVGTFRSLPQWTDSPEERFFSAYLQSEPDGTMKKVTLFYPRYYRSMAARLGVYGGREVLPERSSYVVQWEETVRPDGKPGKLIKSLTRFSTYEAAVEHLENQTGPGVELVGVSPLETPIPLPRLERFESVFQSTSKAGAAGGREVPEVEIFVVR